MFYCMLETMMKVINFYIVQRKVTDQLYYTFSSESSDFYLDIYKSSNKKRTELNSNIINSHYFGASRELL